MTTSRSPTATSDVEQCFAAVPLIPVPRTAPDAVSVEGDEAELRTATGLGLSAPNADDAFRRRYPTVTVEAHTILFQRWKD
jgi:hypothetical protein